MAQISLNISAIKIDNFHKKCKFGFSSKSTYKKSFFKPKKFGHIYYSYNNNFKFLKYQIFQKYCICSDGYSQDQFCKFILHNLA